jgi:1-acyl-sn-glycerol-3-phosphate acyltransferase
MLSIHQGSLGHIRYVLKSDLKWIPLFGFYFQQVKLKTKNKINKSAFV